jgi:hypothetical protein
MVFALHFQEDSPFKLRIFRERQNAEALQIRQPDHRVRVGVPPTGLVQHDYRYLMATYSRYRLRPRRAHPVGQPAARLSNSQEFVARSPRLVLRRSSPCPDPRHNEEQRGDNPDPKCDPTQRIRSITDDVCRS